MSGIRCKVGRVFILYVLMDITENIIILRRKRWKSEKNKFKKDVAIYRKNLNSFNGNESFYKLIIAV